MPLNEMVCVCVGGLLFKFNYKCFPVPIHTATKQTPAEFKFPLTISAFTKHFPAVTICYQGEDIFCSKLTGTAIREK